jgi:hypothetical protein
MTGATERLLSRLDALVASGAARAGMDVETVVALAIGRAPASSEAAA